MGRKFTILGEQHSGKTCYLMALFRAMAGNGIEGYTITTQEVSDHNKLLIGCENLINRSLPQDERFPTASLVPEPYHFNLCFKHENIMPFDWLDYPGGYLLKKADITEEKYNEFTKNIQESSTLFICVDGELLSGENDTIEDKIDKLFPLSTKVNVYFNAYISSGKKMPPVAFIVTKYDLCSKAKITDDQGNERAMTKDDLKKILSESFTAFFTSSSNKVGIIPVTLGKKISDNNYQGRFAPQDVHLPIFMGIYFALRDQIKADRDNADKIHDKESDTDFLRRKIVEAQRELLNLQNEIASMRKRKLKEEDKFFLFRDDALIASLRTKIAVAEREVERLEDKIDEMQRKIRANGAEIEQTKKLISSARPSGVNFAKYLDEIEWFSQGKWQDGFGGLIE